MPISSQRTVLAACRIATLAGLSVLALTSCHPSSTSTNTTVTPGSPEYAQIVSAFFSSAVALQAGDTDHAPALLDSATKLAPQEPATWANLALNQLRLSQIDQAATTLKKASDLAPDNPVILALQARIAVDKGDFAGAVGLFNKAIAKDPNNLKTRWAHNQTIEQTGGADADKQNEKQHKEILKLRPN